MMITLFFGFFMTKMSMCAYNKFDGQPVFFSLPLSQQLFPQCAQMILDFKMGLRCAHWIVMKHNR